MTIEKQLNYYFELTRSDFKKSTSDLNKNYIKKLLDAVSHFNVTRLEDIDLELGYKIRGYFKEKYNNKNTTINKHMNYLKRVMKHFKIYTDVLDLVNLKDDTTPFKRFYHEELKAIIDYVKTMNYSENSVVYKTFVLFALDSGVRVSEALNILIRNIDFENNRIYLEVTKTGKARYAPFSNFSKKELIDLIKINPTRQYLFYNFLKDRPLSKNDIALFYKRTRKKLGITRLYTHRFRKTFGSMLTENGLPIEMLQSIYNHSRITTTIKYVQYRESKALSEYAKYVDWKL